MLNFIFLLFYTVSKQVNAKKQLTQWVDFVLITGHWFILSSRYNRASWNYFHLSCFYFLLEPTSILYTSLATSLMRLVRTENLSKVIFSGKDNLYSSTENIKATRDTYLSGLNCITDLLNAQLDYQNVAAQLAEVNSNYLIVLSEYKFAIGKYE